MRARAFCGVLLALATVACGVACGQEAKPGTGTVTGHVICQDTRQPARFAQVMVFAVPTSLTGKLDVADSKSIQSYIIAQTEARNSMSFVLAQADFDGGFVVNDVAPGDYYVMVSVAGYLQPQDLLQAAYDADGDLTKGVPGVPTAEVSADRSVNVEVDAIRGAAVEGRVLWDDGGPVNAAVVSVEPKAGERRRLPPQFTMMRMNGQSDGKTDDRGHYRIAGLAPGEYTVRAMLITNHRMTMQRGQMRGSVGSVPLLAYAPEGFKKTDAKPIKLGAGEQRTEEDITFNVSATHTVSGRVTSAEDHHGLNNGVVNLMDAADKTFIRTAVLDAEGNFAVTFVPSGTYTMMVTNAVDAFVAQPEKREGVAVGLDEAVRAVHTYQRAERPVMVSDSDLTGQNFELKPEKPADADASDGDQGHVLVGTGH